MGVGLAGKLTVCGVSGDVDHLNSPDGRDHHGRVTCRK
jgi:hypothetical protein